MKTYPKPLWRDFFTELAWLIRHGITLQAALHLLLKQHRLKPLRAFLYHCLHCVTQGQPLSFALMQSPQSYLFHPFVICGETSGMLDSALAQCAQWLSQTIHFQAQCRSLAFYPILLTVLLIAGSALLLGVIVPEFYALYQAFNVALPSTMAGLWKVHVFLTTWGGLTFLGVVALGGILGILCHRYALLLRIPVFKELCHAHECAHMGMLLSGGIALLQALPLVCAHTRFAVHRDILGRVMEALTEGQTLSHAYRSIGWHDPYLCDILTIAEQSGTLDESYLKLCDYYTAQLDKRLQRFKQEWQPFIMLTMGGLVGIWVLLLYYPLIQLGYAMG